MDSHFDQTHMVVKVSMSHGKPTYSTHKHQNHHNHALKETSSKQ